MQSHEWVLKQDVVILWARTIGTVRICVVGLSRDMFCDDMPGRKCSAVDAAMNTSVDTLPLYQWSRQSHRLPTILYKV